MTNVIIYHDNCPDGWGAAWWLARHIGDHVKIPGRYGDPPPLDTCAGADVWLVDFSYPGDDLLAIRDAARTVTLFDHHATTVGYLADAGLSVRSSMRAYCDARMSDTDGINRFDGVLDQNRSGVGLVAEYVMRTFGVNAPDFVDNIEDRDLWRFKWSNTKHVFAAVTAREYTTADWDALATTFYEDLIVEGAAINRYRDRLIDQVAASPFDLTIGDHTIPCVTAPYAIGSDVAGALAERSPGGIGAYAILHADTVQLGLRSRGDGPDVAVIAEQHGGGGHVHASGLRVTWDEFASMAGQPDYRGRWQFAVEQLMQQE